MFSSIRRMLQMIIKIAPMLLITKRMAILVTNGTSVPLRRKWRLAM